METVAWVRVTPEIAERWLERNGKNRTLSDFAVNQMATDMRQGRWTRNPQVIIIDSNRDIIDGQHRLWAVVESGIPTDFLVVQGTAPEVRDSVDTGRQRTTAHMLTMHGVESASKVGAVARLSWMYDHHQDRVWTGDQNLRPTKQALLEYALERKELLLAGTNAGMRMRHDQVLKIPNRMTGGAMAVILRRTAFPEKVDPFVTGIGHGVGLEKGDPRLALRKVGVTRDSWLRGGTGGEQAGLCIIIKAWNAWCLGKPMTFARWQPSELPMVGPV